jgi:outer membrane biosynthesis protein TonB
MRSYLQLGLVMLVGCAATGPAPVVVAPTLPNEVPRQASAPSEPIVAKEAPPPEPTPAPTPEEAVKSADEVVSTMRKGFRACYNAGLNTDPTMSGNLKINLIIRPDGSVASATVTEGKGLAPAVMDCIVRKAESGVFAPPGDKGATIVLPIRFQQQGP